MLVHHCHFFVKLFNTVVIHWNFGCYFFSRRIVWIPGYYRQLIIRNAKVGLQLFKIYFGLIGDFLVLFSHHQYSKANCQVSQIYDLMFKKCSVNRSTSSTCVTWTTQGKRVRASLSRWIAAGKKPFERGKDDDLASTHFQAEVTSTGLLHITCYKDHAVCSSLLQRRNSANSETCSFESRYTTITG